MYKCRLSCYERLENMVMQTTYKFLIVSSLGLVDDTCLPLEDPWQLALVLIIFSSKGRMEREIGVCPFPILGTQLGSGICLVTIDRHSNYMISLS